jgi:hypothetical protein
VGNIKGPRVDKNIRSSQPKSLPQYFEVGEKMVLTTHGLQFPTARFIFILPFLSYSALCVAEVSAIAALRIAH